MTRAATIAIDFLVPFGILMRSKAVQSPFGRWSEVAYRFLPHTFFIYWLFSFVPLIGGLIYMLVFVHLSARIQARGGEQLSWLYLVYLVVILIGFGGVWSFTGHFFLADQVAEGIGWPRNSPFQTELAFFSLGSAVAALMVIWFRDMLIAGVVIAKSVFWYGAAYTHIRDAILNDNYAMMNVGAPLIGDLVYPTLMLGLLWQNRHRFLSNPSPAD